MRQSCPGNFAALVSGLEFMSRQPSFVMIALWPCAFAFLAAIASAAHGSCGDWLVHSDGRPGFVVTFRAANFDAKPMSFTTRIIEPVLPPVPMPCHGPHCGQAPDRSLPPVPTMTSPPSEQIGLTASSAPSSSAAGRFGTKPGHRVHPAKGFFPGLDHPPRV
jgi:hypothetical protein